MHGMGHMFGIRMDMDSESKWQNKHSCTGIEVLHAQIFRFRCLSVSLPTIQCYIQTDNDYSFNIVLGVSISIFIDCNSLTKYIYI